MRGRPVSHLHQGRRRLKTEEKCGATAIQIIAISPSSTSGKVGLRWSTDSWPTLEACFTFLIWMNSVMHTGMITVSSNVKMAGRGCGGADRLCPSCAQPPASVSSAAPALSFTQPLCAVGGEGSANKWTMKGRRSKPWPIFLWDLYIL